MRGLGVDQMLAGCFGQYITTYSSDLGLVGQRVAWAEDATGLAMTSPPSFLDPTGLSIQSSRSMYALNGLISWSSG
jgi:hypothetical protein